MKNRNTTIDFIRGILIMLVIVGHVIQYSVCRPDWVSGRLYFENCAYKLIYTFHMPLFMAISGFLFYDTLYSKDFFSIVESKIKKILLPIIFWGLLSAMIGIIDTRQFSMKFLLRTILLSNWFLQAVFLASILVAFIEKQEKYKHIIYIVIIITFLVTPDIMGNALTKNVFPFFVLGLWWNQFNCKNKWNSFSKRKKAATMVSLLIIYSFLFVLYTKDTYVYISGVSILKKNIIYQLENLIIRWVIGGIGSLIVLFICLLVTKIANQRIIGLFSSFGKKSLGLYVISTLMFENGLLLQTKYLNVIFIIGNTIFISLVCTMITQLLSYNTLVRKITLGGR